MPILTTTEPQIIPNQIKCQQFSKFMVGQASNNTLFKVDIRKFSPSTYTPNIYDPKMTRNTARLRVKLIARNLVDADDPTWHNQLDLSRFGPDGASTIEFTLNPDDRNYDWLVVYDEIPKLPVDASRPNGPTRQTRGIKLFTR